jgi:hypothetical protein
MKQERTNIPASLHAASRACGLWEILLTEALDGLLDPGDEVAFHEHMTHCSACAALFEEARKGREWLEFLAPEPEMPAGLLSRILEHTGPGQEMDSGLASSLRTGFPVPVEPTPFPVWQRPGLASTLHRYAEPRLLMTAAMAFFSIALTLNMSGVQLRNLRLASLRPTAVRSFMERRLTTASTPIVRYYDHLRLVNEVEARVRELRRSSQGEGQDEDQQKPKNSTPASPGETKKIPHQKWGGSGEEPALLGETSAQVNATELSDASLTQQNRPAHSGGSEIVLWERSTIWTA